MRICVIGDSNANGAPLMQGSFRRHLFGAMSATGRSNTPVGSVVDTGGRHEGHNGWRVDNARSSIGSIMDTWHPEVIILWLGTNDLLQPDCTDQSRAELPLRYGLMLEDIRKRDSRTKIIACQIPLVDLSYMPLANSWVANANAALQNTVNGAKESGVNVQLADTNRLLSISDLEDGVHLNDRGHQNVSIILYQQMVPV